MDVYATFIEFLRQTAIVVEQAGAGEETIAEKIQGQVPNIVKAIGKALTGKSEKTRIGALQLLRELCTVIPNSLNGSSCHPLLCPSPACRQRCRSPSWCDCLA